jgi:alpha-L-fucosidase
MNLKQLLKNTLLLVAVCTFGATSFAQTPQEPMQTGKFQASWESLQQYEAPEWFQNVKFGIWAHWGPQCQPEQGDWYARFMYDEGSNQYKWHLQHYGHPSEFGFKDVINSWKAEKWDPEALVKLYKRCGAQYFFAMANHHDNFDLWNSKYQPWNSVNMGPKKDIIAGWAKAAKNNGLRFGLSVHSAHAWTWYETAQRSDKQGPYAGKPYDGTLTKADGKGKWWEGYDPQDLYAQNHPLSDKSEITKNIHSQWNWNNGASKPSDAYCNTFYNRTVDLINQFHPDLLYFDDTALPLWPVSNVGLKIAAHYYNQSISNNKGKNDVVLFGKILTDEQKKCMVWDVEKGAPDKIQDKPWQTCTCIGGWHYEQWRYEKDRYKPAWEVIRTLADVVSKNGNLLLNIPVKGDGSIDDKELAVLNGIAGWMDVNKEAIFDTHPWKIFGEGPVTEKGNPINAQGFNEGTIRKLTPQDIRFTQKGNNVYAIVMARPENGQVVIHSLASNNPYTKTNNLTVELLGHGVITHTVDSTGLKVNLPEMKESNMALVLKISNKK